MVEHQATAKGTVESDVMIRGQVDKAGSSNSSNNNDEDDDAVLEFMASFGVGDQPPSTVTENKKLSSPSSPLANSRSEVKDSSIDSTPKGIDASQPLPPTRGGNQSASKTKPPPPPPPRRSHHSNSPSTTKRRRAPPPPPPPPPLRRHQTPEGKAAIQPISPTPSTPVVKTTTIPSVGNLETPPPGHHTPTLPRRTTLVEKKSITQYSMSTPEAQTKDQSQVQLQPQPQTPRTPQLVFYDEKDTSNGLKKLQESTMKRRRENLTRMHDLDCQLAKLTTMFTEEVLDRNLALRDTLDRAVGRPLEEAVDRFAMERTSSDQRGPLLSTLEQRLSSMDRNMTHHLHYLLNDAKRDELDCLQNDLFQDILPRLHMEDSKSEKIAGGVVRRFESVAGILARQFHQESAARRASLGCLKQDFDQIADQESKKGESLLQDIRRLRERVRREKEQRKAEDKIIMHEITRTTTAMKRSLLAAVSPS